METNNLNHIGADAVIANLMIHSVSPQGRRLVEQMYTGNPFKIDIKLSSDAKNRSAEIANTYLKTVGRRLKFIKKLKVRHTITECPVVFDRPIRVSPVAFVQESLRKDFDYEKDWQEMKERERRIKEENIPSPVEFYGIDLNRKEEEE